MSQPTRSLHLLFLLLIFFISFLVRPVLSEQDLKMVIVLMRHGDRSPIIPLAQDEAFWLDYAGGSGQLTSRGYQQCKDVGALYQKHYGESGLSFVTSKVFRPYEISARGSGITRTLVSARAFFHGFYNSSQTLLPIHSMLAPDLLVRGPDFCDRFLVQYDSFRRSGPFLAKFEESRPLLDYLSNFFGIPVNISNIQSVSESVHSLLIHGFNVHSPITNESFSTMRATELAQLSDRLFVDSFPASYGPLAGGYLLDHVVGSLEKCVDELETDLRKDCSQRFRFILGHDVTIASLLNALGHDLKRQPPFASQLVFELSKEKNTALFKSPLTGPHAPYFVRVFLHEGFENSSVAPFWSNPIQVNGCPENAKCPFDYFVAGASDNRMANPVYGCMVDYSRYVAAYVVLVLFGLLLLFTVFGLYVSSKPPQSMVDSFPEFQIQ